MQKATFVVLTLVAFVLSYQFSGRGGEGCIIRWWWVRSGFFDGITWSYVIKSLPLYYKSNTVVTTCLCSLYIGYV